MKQRLGNEIDNHTYVIRFNMAPVKGFENVVGSKTTHMFIWHKHASECYSKMLVDKDLNCVITPSLHQDIDAYLKYKSKLPSSDKVRWMKGPDQNRCQKVYRMDRPICPQPRNNKCIVSAGAQALLWATNFDFDGPCKTVDIYGMGQGVDACTPFHYYGARAVVPDDCTSKTKQHIVLHGHHNHEQEHRVMNEFYRNHSYVTVRA